MDAFVKESLNVVGFFPRIEKLIIFSSEEKKKKWFMFHDWIATNGYKRSSLYSFHWYTIIFWIKWVNTKISAWIAGVALHVSFNSNWKKKKENFLNLCSNERTHTSSNKN